MSFLRWTTKSSRSGLFHSPGLSLSLCDVPLYFLHPMPGLLIYAGKLALKQGLSYIQGHLLIPESGLY